MAKFWFKYELLGQSFSKGSRTIIRNEPKLGLWPIKFLSTDEIISLAD